MAQAPKKAAAAIQPDAGDEDVMVEVLSTIDHDGKVYAEGDSLLLPSGQAQPLIDAGAARAIKG